MKVISLNTWGGEAGVKELQEFIKAHADVDVFCLQEVWHGGEHMLEKKGGGSWLSRRVTTLYRDLLAALPGYVPYYRPHFYDFYGLLLLVKKGITVEEEGEVYIYKEKGYISESEFGNHARILQYVRVQTDTGPRTIANLHGLWNGKGKTDCDERIEQSDRIVQFVRGTTAPLVLLGDFNLRPDTRSLAMIEECGLRNLITDYGITSTCTSHYTKPEKFADYAFVSKGIEVKEFKVLPDEVSDHAPLYLEFS